MDKYYNSIAQKIRLDNLALQIAQQAIEDAEIELKNAKTQYQKEDAEETLKDAEIAYSEALKICEDNKKELK